MAKFDFQYVEMPGQIVLRAEADPAHFGGGRNAFGPFLRFRLYWPYDANLPKHRRFRCKARSLGAATRTDFRFRIRSSHPTGRSPYR